MAEHASQMSRAGLRAPEWHLERVLRTAPGGPVRARRLAVSRRIDVYREREARTPRGLPSLIHPHSAGFAVPALDLKLWAEDSLLSPLFVAFAACFPSKSFIYRFYAESPANPFIYRIYANTPGCGVTSAPTQRSPSPLR